VTDPLARRLAEDLDDAFPALVRQHTPLLVAMLRRSGAGSAAEDLTQETLVRAYRALVGYPPERVRALHVRAWLVAIARNALRNHARDEGRRPRSDARPHGRVEAAAELGLGARPDGTEAIVDGLVDGEALLAALDELDPVRRDAVVLRHVAGLPIAQVAAELGVPVGTAKSHVSRGLSALRTRLGPEGPQGGQR